MSDISAQQLALWRREPQTMVRQLFGATPDAWQDKALSMFPTTPRLAMKASKGPGKTATLSWMAWNFMLTRPHPKIGAVSVSGDNLRDNLWAELAYWREKSDLLKRAFEWQTQRIFHREHPATWFMSARSWSQSADSNQLGNTLAGLHADYIMFLLDESGSIPVEILMSAEAALSSCKEGHIVQAGNTNSLEGALYYACVRQKAMWETVVISGDPDDPLRSPRIDVEWARELIKNEGRDSPWIKVMILGEWPAASINALIGPDEIEAAMKRRYQQYDIENSPKIIGVDVARQGMDNSVIFPRQGLVAFPPRKLLHATGREGGGQVARMWSDWNADACFVDASGGFGWPWVEALEDLGRSPIPIGFGDKARDRRYVNRRSEMYFLLVDWIRKGGALPSDCPELVPQLSQTTYTHKGDALILEPKEVIKKKLQGRSPDESDALALTFAEPVVSAIVSQALPNRGRGGNSTEYDPFKEWLKIA